MADRKEESGFNAPMIGTVHPKGSTIRKNPDGTVTIVPPKTNLKVIPVSCNHFRGLESA